MSKANREEEEERERERKNLRSAAQAQEKPAPAAAPLTAAMVGLSMFRSISLEDIPPRRFLTAWLTVAGIFDPSAPLNPPDAPPEARWSPPVS